MQNDLFGKIERYLDGQLQGEELRLFENDLQNNKELREQVRLYQTIDEEMKQKAGDTALKQTLHDLNKKYFSADASKGKLVKMRRTRWIAAAAVIAIVLATGAYFLLNKTTGKYPQQLYASYAIHETLDVERGDPGDSLYKAAARLYNEKKYAEALPMLQTLVAQKSDGSLQLVLIICEMETGTGRLVIPRLEKLAGEYPVFRYQAIWYKALAELKNNDPDGAKATLSTIPPEADTYEKAQALLKEL